MKKSEFVVMLLIVGLIVGCFVGYPYYSLWSKEMKGKARLAEATYSKQIQVEQARAELESSKMRAEAIAIIGEASQKYPEYRTQEFIGGFTDALREGNIEQIIYVPTEANIPILEAGRNRNE